MPLFYQHNIDQHTHLAIWRIEENAEFFLAKVPLKKEVKHPYKMLQHLAGRFVLTQLFDDFPLEEIEIADTRKPFLPDEKYHFSISHCGNYAAAIASSTKRVGVDVEFISPRLESIAHKFLHASEAAYMENWRYLEEMHLQLTTVMWSAKEAVYKWYGKGGVDFKEHMQLNGIPIYKNDDFIDLPFHFLKEKPRQLEVQGRIFDPLVLSWVVSEP